MHGNVLECIRVLKSVYCIVGRSRMHIRWTDLWTNMEWKPLMAKLCRCERGQLVTPSETKSKPQSLAGGREQAHLSQMLAPVPSMLLHSEC